MSEYKAIEKTAQRLETLIHEIVDNCNARNFSSSQEPWTTFSSDFSALPALLGKPPGTLTLDQFLTWFEDKRKRHPSLWLKIVEIKSNVKDSYRAECFVKLEYNGTAKGLTRPGLAIYDFDKKDGRWACCKIVTMGGLVGDGADLSIDVPDDAKRSHGTPTPSPRQIAARKHPSTPRSSQRCRIEHEQTA